MTQAVNKSLSASLLAGSKGDILNPRAVKTRIVCTIGPASNNVDSLKKMILEGMSVARCNFSHGDFAWHESVMVNVRKASEELGITCAIMLDTKGPEIRTGKLNAKEVLLQAGEEFVFTSDESVIGDNTKVSTTYKNLTKAVNVGDQILVSDGLLSFTVLSKTDTEVTTRIDNSGLLGNTKGVNLPGLVVDLPPVTEKDKRDIEFGVKQKVDMIAASFIRTADNVRAIRDLPGVRDAGIMIISKIESQEGLDNFNAVLEESDGIMVARGDLGVEIPIERVATAQKMMIAKCNSHGKPVITATQMLDSMQENPRPTRAEATDVANAVFDGSDCVMLSGETAAGKYPIETVAMMRRICQQAEKDIDYRELYKSLRRQAVPPISIPHSIASSAVKTAWDIQASLLVVVTDTGRTARLVSRYRAGCPIIVITSDPQVARQVLISRGCVPMLVKSMIGTPELIKQAKSFAQSLRLVSTGDTIVAVSGVIEGKSGSTNILKVEVV
eukprot:TRINITY_DN2982_c0_g1_i1.p1 TRINITY_DN2982_c0_g1~~TRINITY_DN2982_c0_g1_i1.p1  ORF type:complete len:508 (-),score=84.37 TRINITY_DN2982_c0_g1_i1:56-1552(-)